MGLQSNSTLIRNKWGYISIEKPIRSNPISARTKFKIIGDKPELNPDGSGLRERESNPGEADMKTKRTPVN